MSCYRIRRLEKELYNSFLPSGFDGEDTVTYQWQQTGEVDLRGHFNFYLSISRNAISKGSLVIYQIIIILLDVAGGMTWDVTQYIYNMIF